MNKHITKDGDEIDINTMSDLHLVNTIKLICTRLNSDTVKCLNTLTPYAHEVLINVQYEEEKNKGLRELLRS